MFFTYCKDSGCVIIKGSEHPARAFNLVPNFDEHFAIIELQVNPSDYYGKMVKIQEGAAVVIGPINEENLKTFCGDCPSPIQ
jgi:hypothetical protein